MSTSEENQPTDPPAPRRWRKLLSHPVFIAFMATVFGLISTVVVMVLQRPEPSPDATITALPETSHPYSFNLEGTQMSGESNAPFERGVGYYARVEACDLFGVEGIFGVAACYLTVRLSENMTISNSENLTEAFYSNGDNARICCMTVNNDYTDAIYLVRLPAGQVNRRTYQRGSEIQIIVTIPNIELDHQLDEIRFAPGEGTAAVSFPIRDRINNRIISRAALAFRRGDPRVDAHVREAIRMKAEFESREEINRGLTYRPQD